MTAAFEYPRFESSGAVGDFAGGDAGENGTVGPERPRSKSLAVTFDSVNPGCSCLTAVDTLRTVVDQGVHTTESGVAGTPHDSGGGGKN